MTIEPLDLSEARYELLKKRRLAPLRPGVGGRRNFFSAATQSSLTADWNASIFSADQELWTDLRLMRARSRELARNDWIMSRFLGLLSVNVVGKNGIMPQVRVQMQRGSKINEKLSDQIETVFAQWARLACSDRRQTFRDLQRLAVRTWAQDGEFLFQEVHPPSHPFKLAYKPIDSDQLDHTFFVERQKNGNEIRMGVEIDPDGVPVTYYVWNHHPSEWTSVPKERKLIKADEIIHHYFRNRVGQTRGYPWLAPAMFSTNMLRGEMEAELTASRASAAKMGFFESPTGDDYTGEPSELDESRMVAAAEAGTFESLPAGMKFVAFDPQHPAGSFGPFVKACTRAIASALMVSYHSLGNDLESVNFSSARVGELADRDVWRDLQQHLIDHLCTPIFRKVLAFAVLTEQLDLGPYSIDDVAEATIWKPRGWEWVDPLKDSQSKALDIQNGFETVTNVLAEKGRDLEDLIEERKSELDAFSAAGIKVGTDTKGKSDTATDTQTGTLTDSTSEMKSDGQTGSESEAAAN